MLVGWGGRGEGVRGRGYGGEEEGEREKGKGDGDGEEGRVGGMKEWTSGERHTHRDTLIFYFF